MLNLPRHQKEILRVRMLQPCKATYEISQCGKLNIET